MRPDDRELDEEIRAHLAISVREAIRDAVASFGAAGGEVPLASPATHEAILAAIKKRLAGANPASSSARAAE